MKKKLKGISIAIATLLSFSLLAGCGNSNPSGNAGTATPKTTGTATATPGNTSGGTPSSSGNETQAKYTELNVGYATGWDTLTPIRSNIARNADFAPLVYESLVYQTADKEFVPRGAKSWVSNDDGFTYEIEIYDYINDAAGNHITASDIVWLIEENRTAALRPAFAKIVSVEQTGDYTFSIKMNTNQIGQIESVLVDSFVVSKAAYEASSDGFATKAITTSAYQITNFAANSSITFEKQDNYWQEESLMHPETIAKVDKITYHIIAEASQMGIALETGIIDIAQELAPATGTMFLNDPKYTVDLSDAGQGWQLFFSGGEQSPVAFDQKLRQAICYSLDKDGMITGVASGFGAKQYTAGNSGFIGFNEKWKNEDYYDYNPDKAKQLLAESNYKGESLILLCSTSGLSQRTAQMIQSYLLAVGIKCELLSGDLAMVTSIRLDGTKYDMFINTIGGTFISDLWTTRLDSAAYKGKDATGRHDPVLNELLYKTWTPNGFTEKNIDEVHYYIKDQAYALGMFTPQKFIVWRNDIGLTEPVYSSEGLLRINALTFDK